MQSEEPIHDAKLETPKTEGAYRIWLADGTHDAATWKDKEWRTHRGAVDAVRWQAFPAIGTTFSLCREEPGAAR
jgi:hypothetical protein